jgi:hypothetical protein
MPTNGINSQIYENTRSIGELKAGQESIKESLDRLETKMDGLTTAVYTYTGHTDSRLQSLESDVAVGKKIVVPIIGVITTVVGAWLKTVLHL